MTPTAIRSTECAPRSAYAQLQLQVADRATDTAIIGVRGDEIVDRTWQELGLRVERAAAAFLRADFRRHHVVIMAMRPSPDAVEVELAVRAVGAVPLLVAPDVTWAELAPHLTGVRVRLVVSDDADAVARLAGHDLSRVEHLVLGGDNWERVQAVGAAHLLERPTCVRDAAATGPVTQQAVHVLREGDRVVVRRLPAVVADGLPAETTLLNGPAWDPRVAAVRATLLDTGGALAWTDDPAHLPVLVRHANPHVLATFTEGGELAILLRDAHVNGRQWHRSPADVLSATVTLTSGGRRRVRGATQGALDRGAPAVVRAAPAHRGSRPPARPRPRRGGAGPGPGGAGSTPRARGRHAPPGADATSIPGQGAAAPQARRP